LFIQMLHLVTRKVHVDGAELDVLFGAAALLSRIQVLVLHIGGAHVLGRYDPAELGALLGQTGLRFSLDDEARLPKT